MRFPTVAPRPGESLEAAYRRILETFSKAGIRTHDPEMLKIARPDSDALKYFLATDESPPRRVLVVTRGWTKETTRAVANFLITHRETGILGPSTFHVLSSEPPPDFIASVAADGLRGQLEREALSYVRHRRRIPPPELSDLGRAGAAAALRFLGLSGAESWEARLDGLTGAVSSRLRPEGLADDRELPEEEYVPYDTLVLLGAWVGEILRNHERLRGKWVEDDPDVYPAGVRLALWDRRWGDAGSDEENPVLANPIGKITKLYVNGTEDDLLFFARTILDAARERKEGA